MFLIHYITLSFINYNQHNYMLFSVILHIDLNCIIINNKIYYFHVVETLQSLAFLSLISVTACRRVITVLLDISADYS